MTDQPADSPTTDQATPYRVLARKYRPATFDDLIGQEALVRTLTNAIATGRLAQAYVLTGVRGVGKTTTARIIARALNCIGPDGSGGPTAKPCGVCANCVAIAGDRHVDVIEMDAASRTGIDDIRELIESVRYRPVQARKKVYIVDEVHMLSKQAFNGLLKTLEEPPEHVVFIFATTEIRKVPVTVLSRCQRFDLRRVEQEVLTKHFARIAEAEGIEVEPKALAIIARSADGSVRDGLSLLDQAIALGEGKVAEAQVRDMLGLADRTQVFDLFEATLRGQAPDALALLGELYAAGADPGIVLQDLLELAHFVTRAELVPATLDSPEVPEAERVRGRAMAETLSLPVLSRTWQMLLKGLGEVQTAPAPLRAAEMVLIRLAYASELPTPAELVANLSGGGPAGGSAGPGPVSTGSGGPGGQTQARARDTVATPPRGDGGPRAMLATEQAAEASTEEVGMAKTLANPDSFEAVLALVRARRETILANHLAGDVHFVRFERGRIELRPTERAPRKVAGELSRVLQAATGERWVVSISQEPGQPTLRDQAKAEQARAREETLSHPLVRAALDAFPGARLVESEAPPPVAAPPADNGMDDRAADNPDAVDQGDETE